MANALPAQSPPAKLGWSGQPVVKVPAAGLTITPGSGLIGRTVGNALFLDNARDTASEVVSLFAPGLVAAKTLGKWRNRRANGTSTLAVMEANLGTVGTAGDATNFFKVVATDSAGVSAVLPISNPLGQSFYDLDRVAGAKIVDPWTGKGTGTVSQSGGAGWALPFVPSQPLFCAGFTATFNVLNAANNAVTAKVRGQLWQQNADKTLTLLSTAYVSSIAGGAINVLSPYSFDFPFTIPLSSGVRYFFTFDIFEAFDNGTACQVMQAGFADAFGTTTNTGQPAAFGTYGVAGTDGVRVVARNTATVAGMNALTWDTIAQITANGSLPAGAGFLNTSGGSNQMSAGVWAMNGTLSALAPLSGDITFTIAAQGAPGAGTAGSDLNLRALILP